MWIHICGRLHITLRWYLPRTLAIWIHWKKLSVCENGARDNTRGKSIGSVTAGRMRCGRLRLLALGSAGSGWGTGTGAGSACGTATGLGSGCGRLRLGLAAHLAAGGSIRLAMTLAVTSSAFAWAAARAASFLANLASIRICRLSSRSARAACDLCWSLSALVRGLLFFFFPRDVLALHLFGMTTDKWQDI